MHTLDDGSLEHIKAALEVLSEIGPGLGRPLVDTVSQSRHRNMKELRPGSVGRSEVRILFAFDPERKAILLVGGDKSRQWNRWYKQAIVVADALYDAHLLKLEASNDDS
ncbi:diaminopimelate decarboxylase [Gordonia sp. TBRC 11910]|uniref:Diaminopimelate decarboxylase n=2 Tax=Gordonia asplenii TaxID=2725283 RepID=A0A848L1F9_9ACTN|nr:diaminopimelate decarboxylase [Gordonia asplenii]